MTAPNKLSVQGSLDAMVNATAAVPGAGGRADEDRQRRLLPKIKGVGPGEAEDAACWQRSSIF
jgi:hypothetical protein